MTSAEPHSQKPLARVTEALEKGTLGDVSRMLRKMEPAEAAHLLESSPPRSRQVLWQLIDDDLQGEVLNELGYELQLEFLSELEPAQVAQLTEGLDDDDVADILQQLPDEVTFEVLEAMDHQDRARLEQVIFYADDTAGGLMNTDAITIRADLTLDVVLRYLRRHETIPAATDNLIVVNRDDRYVGLLPLRTLLVSDPSHSVRELMVTSQQALPVDMPDDEVARLFERNDWVSAPVVDADGRLLGRITIDDVVDVIREDADHSFMAIAGLDEDEDTFAPVLRTAKRRTVWLAINLLTAFIASGVINQFQATIEKVVALAVLMPIVASMGGNAGTQSLAVAVRALATRDLTGANSLRFVWREAAAGLVNGLIFAVVMGVIAAVWFQEPDLGYVIAIAMVINLAIAGLAGVLVPLGLKHFGADPAVASSVFVTTVTDVVGFVVFLGLGALVLL